MKNQQFRLFSEDMAEFLTNFCLASSVDEDMIGGEGHSKSVNFYGAECDIVLTQVKEKVEDLVGKRLKETYGFMRVYKEGDELPLHTDRDSCEYSLTICLGTNALCDWPIFVGGECFSLSPGEAVLYKGIDQPHFRFPLQKINCADGWSVEQPDNIFHAQMFLHYIDVNGPHYPEHSWDGRGGPSWLK